MNTIISIATTGTRYKELSRTIDSLMGQADEIMVYDNSRFTDYTDNAKFYPLQFITEPCYFITCDDDMEYPSDFVSRFKHEIDNNNCIVTAHGRILVQGQNSYYNGKHICFKHNGELRQNVIIDVAGTGCAGFRTDYFNPIEIYKSEYKRMSDLVFSIEAAKQGKKIICIKHPFNWIKSLHLKGIMDSFKNQPDTQQVELMNKIIELKR